MHSTSARNATTRAPRLILQKNDVLICKDGAGIGKVGIVGRLPGKATINSSLLLIRAGGCILPKFLYRCLSSPYFQKIVNSRLNGATTPHLYQRDITDFPIVLPSLPEQRRIVSILDEAFDGIATAKANAERTLQNGRALFKAWIAAIRYNGTLIASYGIRRGSKEQGHDYIPGQIKVTMHQAKMLSQCPMSYDEWVVLMKNKGVIPQDQVPLSEDSL